MRLRAEAGSLIDVHADAYADQMDDPIHQRFAWFVDHWTGWAWAWARRFRRS
ncbi:hypothetical protein GCM10022403_042460 [Streptomyces coacervatus]|uniref:Uncharacterized protein n=1 Tax=Streptomyces coacervatus TaxID=647381 RepID=A0ABP7HWN0_9ACTN